MGKRWPEILWLFIVGISLGFTLSLGEWGVGEGTTLLSGNNVVHSEDGGIRAVANSPLKENRTIQTMRSAR